MRIKTNETANDGQPENATDAAASAETAAAPESAKQFAALCERCQKPAAVPEGQSPLLQAETHHKGLCGDHGATPAKRTAEDWARTKGMFHEFTEGKRGPKARPKSKPPLVHNPKHAPFKAARDSLRWPIGHEITESEFDEAIAKVQAHVYR